MKLAIAHPDQVGPLITVDALPALGAAQMPNLTADQLQAAAAPMRDGMLRQRSSRFEAQQRYARIDAFCGASAAPGWPAAGKA